MVGQVGENGPGAIRKDDTTVSLVYRAIWQDEPDGIHGRGLDAFRWWVGKRSDADRTFADDVTETTGDVSTLVRTGRGDAGSIRRCSLTIDDGTDRRITTLTTTAAGATGTIRVDLERETHRTFATFGVQAPPLSTHLIAQGVRPHRGPVRLSVKPRALHADEIPRFAHLLGDPARDLPILVTTPGPDLDARACLDAATHAARVLAGSAAVHLVGPAGRVNLSEILGSELGPAPGEARLYLPGVAPDEPNPARHHRLDAARVARDPMAMPFTILQFLAPATASRRIPAGAAALQRLLEVDPDAVERERTALQERIVDLEDQLAAAEDRTLELVADLEGSEERVNLLQAALARTAPGPTPPTPTATVGIPIDVNGLVAAAREARRHLDGIVLPPEACHDLEELDRRIESGAWGRTAWRGLLALHAFASDRDFQPGFWLWCKANRSPFGWPASAKKLAMRESETVMAQESLASKRRFPVDPAVSASGWIEMQAHLKIAEGGNHQIPRIYFHDDRHGATGKVHIGFFGPHRYVPNTLT